MSLHDPPVSSSMGDVFFFFFLIHQKDKGWECKCFVAKQLCLLIDLFQAYQIYQRSLPLVPNPWHVADWAERDGVCWSGVGYYLDSHLLVPFLSHQALHEDPLSPNPSFMVLLFPLTDLVSLTDSTALVKLSEARGWQSWLKNLVQVVARAT